MMLLEDLGWIDLSMLAVLLMSGYSAELLDADRAMPPAIGSTVTFRYDGLTAKGTPRFARFQRVRRD